MKMIFKNRTHPIKLVLGWYAGEERASKQIQGLQIPAA